MDRYRPDLKNNAMVNFENVIPPNNLPINDNYNNNNF